MNKYLLLFILTFCYIQSSKADNNECGRTNYSRGLIVNGVEVNRGEFPFSIALLQLDKSEYFCGGCLITTQHALTASHCIQDKDSTKILQPKDIIAILGKHNLQHIYEKDAQQVTIQKIKMHEDWRSTDRSYDGDIAILTFEKEITLTDYVRTICLPQSIDYNELQNGVIVGWGMSEKSNFKKPEPTPRKTDINTPPSNEECFLNNQDLAKISSNRTYCAGGESVGPCFGDSGGGFFVIKDGLWFLQGIISATIISQSTQCDVHTYALYTNVALYVDWIWQNIKGFKPLTIACQYNNSQKLKDKPYFCDAKPKVYTDDFTATGTSGKHLSGKSNKDVTVLNFSGKNEVLEMHFIPKKLGLLFVNLKTLFIQNGQLKSLSRTNFQNMNNLMTISLTNNQIKKIDIDTFYDLKNLESLRLNGNRLKDISTELLIHARNLQHLLLGRNFLETFDQKILVNNIHLKTLDLSENKLKTIKFNFSLFPELDIATFDDNACINDRYIKRTPKNIETLQEIINKKCIIKV